MKKISTDLQLSSDEIKKLENIKTRLESLHKEAKILRKELFSLSNSKKGLLFNFNESKDRFSDLERSYSKSISEMLGRNKRKVHENYDSLTFRYSGKDFIRYGLKMVVYNSSTKEHIKKTQEQYINYLMVLKKQLDVAIEKF